MDIKELNKPQLILLAILLSFVTSIATGITTVTLMEQAPSSVTTPINRIVKQTVEKIVQVEGKTSVQTVVVKEEDLVVDSISKNQAAVFIITKEIVDLENKTIEVSAGRGFVVSDQDIIVADASQVPAEGVYYVRNDSGKFKAKFISTDKSGIAFLKVGEPLDEKNKLVYTLPAFGILADMKIGQKIILLGSSINSFIFEGNKNIRMSVTKSNGGGMVLNLDGGVLGIALSGEDSSFASTDTIVEILKVVETAKTQ